MKIKPWLLGAFGLGLVVAFQNCGSSFEPSTAASSFVINSAPSAQIVAGACANSSLKGVWTSNPENPQDLAAETLTVSDDCRASSKLCGGTILFSPIPNRNGGAIQGNVTLQISGAASNPSCLPDGNYSCTYGLGPGATGDVFGARCNNLYDINLYRQVAAEGTPAPTPAPTATPTPTPIPPPTPVPIPPPQL